MCEVDVDQFAISLLWLKKRFCKVELVTRGFLEESLVRPSTLLYLQSDI
jgi:hypothetical protein